MEAYKSLSVFEKLTRELAAQRSAPIPVRRTHARRGQSRGVAMDAGAPPGGELPRLVHAGEDEVVYRLSVPVGSEPDVVLELCAAHLMNLPLLAARKMLDPASLHEMTRLVLQVIWDRNGNVRVDTAAVLLGLNPARLSDHFIQDLGRSATSYRKQYMAEIACAMLGVTALSAREIARILGTKSAEHLAQFIRRFYPDIDLCHAQHENDTVTRSEIDTPRLNIRRANRERAGDDHERGVHGSFGVKKARRESARDLGRDGVGGEHDQEVPEGGAACGANSGAQGEPT